MKFTEENENNWLKLKRKLAGNSSEGKNDHLMKYIII